MYVCAYVCVYVGGGGGGGGGAAGRVSMFSLSVPTEFL